MKIQNIDLGKYPVLLAPMEDVTDPAFRLMCKNFGADMVYTEFVSSDALIRSVSKTEQKLKISDEERPVAIQIYGKDTDTMVEAARIVEQARPDILDINFGCPVKRVAGKGAGAGMLQNIPKMLEITRSVVDAVKIPVTVKTRLGWDASNKIIVDLAEQLQDCGIAALTIHGRTRAQMYTGEADWTLIGEVRNNPRMHIPIIGNGDIDSAEKAAAALKNLNIQVDECSSRTDKFGRIKIELKLKKAGAPVLNKLQIMKLVSVVCERDFDVPAVNESGGDIFITLSEHAALRVDVGIEQKCASESMMCGDAYRYFFDGHGHFITVLSDGMGTGGRAAVDGAMASGLMCRLLKAGFGFDCSLKILNSSMLFKSTDESLATVDISSIDLYNGQVELYKAGAAPTVIRRSGRTGKAESTSLPAGILREVRFDKATVKCREGDIIVMMSDGAAFDGCDWIRDELQKWEGGTAQELSERLCEGAHRRRNDNREDDITVITAILKKSV